MKLQVHSTKTEFEVINNIHKLDYKIFILVTHSLRSLDRFNNIYKLENGKLHSIKN